MDAVKSLTRKLSEMIGTNLNGFFAGIAVAVFMLWSNQSTTAKSRPLTGVAEPAATVDSPAAPAEAGDLDEVKANRTKK